MSLSDLSASPAASQTSSPRNNSYDSDSSDTPLPFLDPSRANVEDIALSLLFNGEPINLDESPPTPISIRRPPSPINTPKPPSSTSTNSKNGSRKCRISSFSKRSDLTRFTQASDSRDTVIQRRGSGIIDSVSHSETTPTDNARAHRHFNHLFRFVCSRLARIAETYTEDDMCKFNQRVNSLLSPSGCPVRQYIKVQGSRYGLYLTIKSPLLDDTLAKDLISNLISQYPKLTHLAFLDCDNINFTGEGIAQGLRDAKQVHPNLSLKMLSIPGCYNITDSAIEKISRQNIILLWNIYQCNKLSNSCVERLSEQYAISNGVQGGDNWEGKINLLTKFLADISAKLNNKGEVLKSAVTEIEEILNDTGGVHPQELLTALGNLRMTMNRGLNTSNDVVNLIKSIKQYYTIYPDLESVEEDLESCQKTLSSTNAIAREIDGEIKKRKPSTKVLREKLQAMNQTVKGNRTDEFLRSIQHIPDPLVSGLFLLTVFKFPSNEFTTTDSSVALLVQVLKAKAQNISFLDMSNLQYITDESLRFVSSLENLSVLDLSNARFLTDLSIRSLIESESLKTLKTLDLRGTQISASALERLIQATNSLIDKKRQLKVHTPQGTILTSQKPKRSERNIRSDLEELNLQELD
jgi:hypothetical protein